jgi:voltage-gated potassium channel Kch
MNDETEPRRRRRNPIKRMLLLDLLEDRESRPIFLYAAGTVIVGALLFRWLEGWSWLDAIYFSIVTLTTVGYGDLSPTRPESKLLSIFFIINGVVVLLSLFDRIRAVRAREPHEEEEDE